jgi:hypothetical protein
MKQVAIVRGEKAFEALFGHTEKIGFDEGSSGNQSFQGFSIEKFHHHEGAVPVLPDVEKAYDMRRIERGEGMALSHQIIDLILGAPFLRKEALNGDLSLKLVVVALKNRAQASLAKFTFDFIAILWVHTAWVKSLLRKEINRFSGKESLEAAWGKISIASLRVGG